MMLLLLILLVIIMLGYYSNKSATVSPSPTSPLRSVELTNMPPAPEKEDIALDSNRVDIYLNRLSVLDKSINDISHAQLDMMLKFEHRYNAQLTTLTQRLESIDSMVTERALQVLTYRLLISSQSFGCDNFRRGYNNRLDHFDNIIRGIAHRDICAVQDLHVPRARWGTQTPGVTERFNPILNRRGDHLVLHSFAYSEKSGKKNEELCNNSFGFYINPNFNFQFNMETDVESILNPDGAGVLLINGLLFDQYQTVFACIRGSFDPKKPQFDQVDNIELVTRTLSRIKEIGARFYVLIGDFKLCHSVFIHALQTMWRDQLPDIACESDQLSEGSLLSSFDEYGYSQPDHLLTNMRLVDFKLFGNMRLDRMRLDSTLYPLLPSNSIVSGKILKINVPLKEEQTKF